MDVDEGWPGYVHFTLGFIFGAGICGLSAWYANLPIAHTIIGGSAVALLFGGLAGKFKADFWHVIFIFPLWG